MSFIYYIINQVEGGFVPLKKMRPSFLTLTSVPEMNRFGPHLLTLLSSRPNRGGAALTLPRERDVPIQQARRVASVARVFRPQARLWRTVLTGNASCKLPGACWAVGVIVRGEHTASSDVVVVDVDPIESDDDRLAPPGTRLSSWSPPHVLRRRRGRVPRIG